jgi:2-polyprenyl-3-methyl-5-hydroxy-6-metoxy-1,4-benzoquinol methylase
MNLNALITPRYREQQRELHAAPRGYGQRGSKWADVVRALVDEYLASSVLDYGCGTGSLKAALVNGEGLDGVRIDEYDPAIKGKDGIPYFADLVNCTDVLEHVEPDCLPEVLKHLRLLARKAVFVVISTCETAKVLSDGRNAHLIIQPAEWWREQLTAAGFTILPPPAIARKREDKEWCGVLLP